MSRFTAPLAGPIEAQQENLNQRNLRNFVSVLRMRLIISKQMMLQGAGAVAHFQSAADGQQLGKKGAGEVEGLRPVPCFLVVGGQG